MDERLCQSAAWLWDGDDMRDYLECGDENDLEDDSRRVVEACWWLDVTGCDLEVDCGCGPVTLHNMMMNLDDPSLRQEALEAHVALIRELWAHYWAGEAILSGKSKEIGNGCAYCLVIGEAHVLALGEAAHDLGGELG